MSVELAWLVTIIGLVGFWLAGNKVWWAWYVNVANQVLWVIFALVSGYYAFLLGASFYTFVFVKNAIQWTREHLEKKRASIYYHNPKFDPSLLMRGAPAFVDEGVVVVHGGSGRPYADLKQAWLDDDVEIKDDYYDEGKR